MDLTKKITKFIPSNRNIVGDNAIADNWQQDEQRRHQTRHFENSNEEKLTFSHEELRENWKLSQERKKEFLKRKTFSQPRPTCKNVFPRLTRAIEARAKSNRIAHVECKIHTRGFFWES